MEIVRQENAALEWALHEHITQALQGLLPPSLRASRLKQVLDINCRIGAWTIALAHSYPGISVTGIDEDEGAITLARASTGQVVHPTTHFRQACFTHPLPFEDATFDFVHVSTTVSHLVEPCAWPALLLECQRVLKSGGTINLVSLSLGPTSSEAWQRALVLIDELRRKLGYGFADMPGGSRLGVHFCRMLRATHFTNVTYRIAPINFGGMNNARGRSCYQYLLEGLRKGKAKFLAFDLIHEDDFDCMLEQQQRDIVAIDYCATGAVISALGVKE